MYQSVFHRVIGRKKGYMYINNNKDKLTFRSRVVSWFVLVSDSVQLTYKKYLVLIICLGIICIRVYFTESLAEKRDTCTSTTVKKNLHLEQEWCPDLYWSLVLCNSPIKISDVNNLSGQNMYHQLTGRKSKEQLTLTSRVVSWGPVDGSNSIAAHDESKLDILSLADLTFYKGRIRCS